MKFLEKQYEVETDKTRQSIFEEVLRKKEEQRKQNSFFSAIPINYKSFKICGDRIEIERNLSPFDPFRSTGTISFEFMSSEPTKIRCSIIPYNKYLLAMMSCMFSIFLLVLTLIVFFVLRQHKLEASAFVVVLWCFVVVIPYLQLRLNRGGLEDYSKTILIDLGVSISTGS
jgi:hypothetical protein